MEHHEEEQLEHEDEAYGGEIPDEGEMDADVEMSRIEEEEHDSKVWFSVLIYLYKYVCFVVFSPNFWYGV